MGVKEEVNRRVARKIVAELQAESTKLQLNPYNQAMQIACRDLKHKLIESQHREQLDLQQRAHINWITQGDQGSKFFA